MSDLKFVEEWNANVNISWWKANREKLNKVIKPYNEWLIDGKFEKEIGERLLRMCEQLRQTLTNVTQAYLNDIELMEHEINDKMVK